METEILQAVARGWCHKGYKVMDPELAKAITIEVMQVIQEKASICVLKTPSEDYLAYDCGVANCPVHKDES